MLNLPSCKVVKLSNAEITEAQQTTKQDLDIGRKQKQASFSSASQSAELRGCSINDRQISASKKSEQYVEKEQLSSSCGSVSINPSPAGLHGTSLNIKPNTASLKENVGVNGSLAAENPKFSNTKWKDSCSLKVILNLL